MGFLGVVFGAAATFLLYREGWYWSAGSAGVLTIVALWSYGVMHNFAVESAKERASYTGGFYDFTERDLDAVPDWLAWVAMAATVVLLVMMIGSVVLWAI